MCYAIRHHCLDSLRMSLNGKRHDELVACEPAKFLQALDIGSDADSSRTALIILNCPVPQYEYFGRLYHHAGLRICADGGANRLHDLMTSEYSDLAWEDALRKAPPDLIHGDLDSIADKVRTRYQGIGVEVLKDSDQYSTDFGKCVNKVFERLPNVENVLVLGSIGGRVDQGIGLLGELHREQISRHPGKRFWLFSESSVSIILQPGSTVVETPVSSGLITSNIGILPLYGGAVISTEGLEWDVQNWPTEMGGQVSTSNHVVAERIKVTTDKPVLFTVERAVSS